MPRPTVQASWVFSSLGLANLLALAVFCTSSASIAQSQAPQQLGPADRLLWSDDELGIRFTYPSAWQLSRRTQDSTRVVVNWRLNKSKALLATCYVEVHDSMASQVAELRPQEIRAAAKSIAESAAKNLKQRASDARLLSWKSAVQDGHPVVYVVRQGTLETFDSAHPTKVYSLITAWRSREINFECATAIFGPEYSNLEGGSRLIEQVESTVMSVMRTLQFDRIVAR